MTQKIPSNVEQFHIAPGHEGVVFFGDDYKSVSSVDMKEKAAQALLHQFQRKYSEGGKDYIEYHVFENQRRVFLEWGGHHLMSFERPAYTEESGTTSCPFTNHDIMFQPSDGYEWHKDSEKQWLVDKKYTNTDADGWVYGSDFGYVMQNLREGQSTTTSQLRSVRRRRWKRVAVKIPAAAVTQPATTHGEAAAKVSLISKSGMNEQSLSHLSDPNSERFCVFYNQRRSVLTLSFGPNNLFPTDRHAFTDESGQRSYPGITDVDDMLPPTGCKWAEDSVWKTDQYYTDTDEFGWSYG
jgi:hypothetical protein